MYRYLEGVVSEADALFRLLVEEVDWDLRMRARKTASFGAPYHYSQMRYEARPFLPALEPLIALTEKYCGFRPNNCLLNYYESGRSTMGWHTDESMSLVEGTGVAIFSLGAEREIRFRRVDTRIEEEPLILRPGSLLHLPAENLRVWQHAIPGDERAGPRISATMRAL